MPEGYWCNHDNEGRVQAPKVSNKFTYAIEPRLATDIKHNTFKTKESDRVHMLA